MGKKKVERGKKCVDGDSGGRRWMGRVKERGGGGYRRKRGGR